MALDRMELSATQSSEVLTPGRCAHRGVVLARPVATSGAPPGGFDDPGTRRDHGGEFRTVWTTGT